MGRPEVWSLHFNIVTVISTIKKDRLLDFYALCALYAITDVALITCAWDEINLVSEEFGGCQVSKKERWVWWFFGFTSPKWQSPLCCHDTVILVTFTRHVHFAV